MKTLRFPIDTFRPRRLLGTVAILSALVVPAQAPASDFFGVVSQRELTDLDFERLEGANVETLRLGVGWPALQPERPAPGEPAEIRKSLDDEFGAAAAAGVRILPFVNKSPDWVTNNPSAPPIGSPADRRAFTKFMELVVSRYGTDGEYWTTDFVEDFPGETPLPPEHWQVWNEPTSRASWHPEPKAQDYADLVKLAEKGIHRADPDAKVMLAGIFYSPQGGPRSPKFIKDVLRVDGVKNAIDAVAVNAYAEDVDDVLFQIEEARNALEDSNAGDKELFITESAWSTCPQSRHPVCTDARGQANKLKNLFRAVQQKRQAWNLGGIYWYSLVDTPRGDAAVCDTFCPDSGLFKVNREPKPAWAAFKRFTE
jgi:hypothetical protein